MHQETTRINGEPDPNYMHRGMPMVLRMADGTLEVLSGWMRDREGTGGHVQYRARIGEEWMRAEIRTRAKGCRPDGWQTQHYFGADEIGGDGRIPKGLRYMTAVLLAASPLMHGEDPPKEV